MSERSDAGTVVVDLQALQSIGTRDRGIGRYASTYLAALERAAPGLVGTYLLNPRLAPPVLPEAVLSSGRVAWLGDRRAIGDQARVLHLLSPLDPDLELDALWPTEAADLRLSAVVYDLIPLTDTASAFREEGARRRFRNRLELLRACESIQVLADSVGRDLAAALDIAPTRVHRVGASLGAEFRPAPDPSAVRAALAARLGEPALEGSYVLYPSGHHPRKNNEQLARAFGRSGLAEHGIALVISGAFPEPFANHLRMLASPAPIVLPGFLPDEDYLALVQGASLVCFPSHAEGFGLPVAEAIACGIGVIAADVAPLDELVPPPQRFDAATSESITAALVGAIAAPPAPIDPAILDRPDDVASRAVAALRELAASPRRARRVRARRRLALVSPLPPAPTGVAAYSIALAEAIEASGGFEIDYFGDGPTAGQRGPRGEAVSSPAFLARREAIEGRYDEVVYALGNSHHHLGALRALRGRSGVVIAHDVRLSGLYRHLHGDPGSSPGGLERAIESMYGRRFPGGTGAAGEVAPSEQDRLGVLMAREAVRAAQRFCVSSASARELALVDAGPGCADRLRVLPFAFFDHGRAPAFGEVVRAVPEGLALAGRYWGRPPDALLEGAVVASFGIVDPVKEPTLSIEAVARLRRAGRAATLCLVGPVADGLARELAEAATALGLADAFVLTGPLAPDDYRAWLERADLALQLRRSSNGEASAALGECLSAGCPTLVRRRGYLAELPEDAVAGIGPEQGASALADALSALLADEPGRAALGERGRRFAATCTFRRTADALIEVLDERAASERAG